MNEAKKEDTAKFSIELCAGTDLVMDEQQRFNGAICFFRIPIMSSGFTKSVVPKPGGISLILLTLQEYAFIPINRK